MKTDLGYIRGAQGEVGPQGETGAQGPAATIEVGSVTSASYGTAPKVTNSGTSTAAVLDFVIPQGPPGETVADVSELTANFITESAESYPTYTTTEKMKVILGKIKKYLADLTTALTGKLDKTDVIANLTATTSGKALDATQGKVLQDQITQLNSDLSGFKIRKVSDDMNNYKSLGIYTGNNLKNAPVSGFVVWINVSQNFDSSFVHQLCFPMNSNDLWVRCSFDNIWKEWRKI